jgi:signal peptidase I
MRFFARVRRDLGQKRWFRWVLAVAFGAALGIGAGRNIMGTVSIVDGDSMVPTFQPGARVLAMPVLSAIARDDIVLLDDGKGDFALKRVVGLPGETIDLWRGYLFVNGKMLVEPYLPKYTLTFPDQQRGRFHFELGPEEYFVLGDNRLFSLDSRSYGPVARDKITGRVHLSQNAPRSRFAPFTLPAAGKTVIRPLPPQVLTAQTRPDGN